MISNCFASQRVYATFLMGAAWRYCNSKTWYPCNWIVTTIFIYIDILLSKIVSVIAFAFGCLELSSLATDFITTANDIITATVFGGAAYFVFISSDIVSSIIILISKLHLIPALHITVKLSLTMIFDFGLLVCTLLISHHSVMCCKVFLIALFSWIHVIR